MKIEGQLLGALQELGRSLPEHTSLQMCVPEGDGSHVCHSFRVSGGRIHHSGSHSDEFVESGSGALE